MSSGRLEVPFDAFFLPADAQSKLNIEGLPSLGALGSAPGDDARDENRRKVAEEVLDGPVRQVCEAYGFQPIVAELAYLSDPFYRGAHQIELSSFLATTDDQSDFAFPGENPNTSGKRNPYFHAIARMIADGDPSTGRAETGPIGGHPSLWQDGYKDWSRLGYTAFRSNDILITDNDFNISRIGDQVSRGAELKVASPVTVPFRIDIDYKDTAGDAFRRFARYFLEEAHKAAEAAPRRLAASFNRLHASWFLGVPYVRSSAETDPSVARWLEQLGWTPARGVMLLLFLERLPGKEASEAGIKQNVDALARSLHGLLTEMGRKEAAARAASQRGLLNYLADIVHDSRHIIRAIRPEAIWQTVASSEENFTKDRWDYMISDGNARLPGQERLLQRAYSSIELMVQLVQQHLLLLEFRARGAPLIPRYQQQDKAARFLPEVIMTAKAMIDQFASSSNSSTNPIVLQAVDDLVKDMTIPVGYLRAEYIIPWIYEMLLNCSQHGSMVGDAVPVSLTAHCETVEITDVEVPFEALRWTVSIANPFLAGQEKPGTMKYENFIPEVRITRHCEGDRYIQSLELNPFLQCDDQGRSTGTFSFVQRSQA